MRRLKLFGGALGAKFGGAALRSKWLILGFLIVFIVIAILVVNYHSSSKMNAQGANIANTKGSIISVPKSGGEGFTGSMNGGSDIEAMFFNVDWCPHCVHAKPEWAKFVQSNSNKNITFVGGKDGTNCTNSDDKSIRDLMQKHNVQHFPTVIFIKDGTPTEFQGKVTAENLEDFLKDRKSTRLNSSH